MPDLCLTTIQNLGVMDSLQHDYLRIMKLFILARGQENNRLIESYTFVFHTTSGSPSVSIAETNQVFCVENLRPSFRKSITALLRSIRDLPNLPRHGRRLGISLLYKQSCPALYQPHGFAATTNNQSTLWENGDDVLQTTKFDTGSITVSIGVKRHEESSDADRRLCTCLNMLQHTSSRDAHLPPTLEQADSSSKRKRPIEDAGSQNRWAAKHSLPSHCLEAPDTTTLDTRYVEAEPPKVTGEGFRHEQLKTSESKVLVQLSSQATTATVSSDMDGGAIR